MLINNIKTEVEFDLGYNPLIFYGLMGLFKVIAHLAGASMSYGHFSSCTLIFSIKLISTKTITLVNLFVILTKYQRVTQVFN